MKLSEIMKGIVDISPKEEREIKDIKINSKEIQEGDLFICLKGVNFDGNEYIREAIDKGAAAVLSDEVMPGCINVSSSRKAYSLACKNYFGSAADRLKLIGVTGTNGKTTTTSIICELLKGAGLKVGLIGTMGVQFNEEKIDTGFTTPDPYTLHKIFAEMETKGIEYVVMEVSAHALYLDKLEGVKFQAGVLTNITEDHLDFFGNMDNYAAAKFKFFDKKYIKVGIVCSDDEYARKLIYKTSLPILSYGLDNPADVFAIDLKGNLHQSNFICNCFDDIFEIKTNLVGKYNIENALAAISVCNILGMPSELIKLNMKYINRVEGRFNVINCKGINVVIDYAHTPDGLEKVLKTSKELTTGNLVALFGCGGNRDKLKRRIMGKIASENADFVFLTSDNPRFEEPMDIINDIRAGITEGACQVIENRREAIATALDYCHDGDTLVIAGKGGEKYQDIKGEKLPYNDFDEVYSYFRDKISEVEEGG